MTRALAVCALLSFMVAGCASPGPTEGIEGELSTFDPATFESDTYYINFDIAPTPLTAEQLGPDVDQAIPVGIRVHEHFAVAWHAPNGEPRVGDHDSVIAAWRLYGADEVERVPTRGDVAPGDDTQVTPPGYDLPDFNSEVPRDATIPRDQYFQTPPLLWVYWLDEWRDAWLEFWLYHPECA